MKVKAYVAAVAVAALVAAALAASVPTPHPSPAYLSGLLFALVAVSEYAQVRHYQRMHVDAMNIMEGILAPVVVTQSGLRTALITALGLAAANLLRRNKPAKSVFNTSMWTVAAVTGSAIFGALHSGSTLDLGALLVALLAMSVVNQALLAGVMRLVRTGDAPTGARRALSAAMVSRGVSIGVSAAVGMMLGVAAFCAPPVTAIGLVLVVTIAAAGRAHAALFADRMRLQGMQRATHALATSIDASSGLPLFLAETRLGFEVSKVDLVLFGEGGDTVHRCVGTAHDGYSVAVGAQPLASLLAKVAATPWRVRADDGSDAGALLAAAGHQRALAVPLRSGGSTLGMLLLYDRVGMEGFETGELAVADALGRELVGFLERVELLKAIDGERRKLADILESTSDGIFSMDAEGTVTSWNAGLVAMTGYAADELVGTRHFGLLRPRDAAGRDLMLERWVETMAGPGGLPTEVQVVAAGGATVWLSCSYSRIPAAEGRSDVLVAVARNVTQARELERLKDDFVAVVSHELRTPLVPIKGWAQTLLARGERLSEDQRRTAVQSILAQAQKLESLVLNILEASRIEAGRMDGEGIADVGAVVRRVVDDTLAARPDRVLRVRAAGVPCDVKGSAVWVERAVTNLVGNAIKYSPEDEAVDVAVTVEGEDVVVAVTDRGPGIAADAHERIFERFERLEETEKQTGTGLGLYITRRLARAMGGDVTVSSVPGAGSTFLLRLPLSPVTLLPEQRQDSPPAAQPDELPNNVVTLR